MCCLCRCCKKVILRMHTFLYPNRTPRNVFVKDTDVLATDVNALYCMCEVTSCSVCYPSSPFLSSLLSLPLFPPLPSSSPPPRSYQVGCGGRSQLLHSLTHSLIMCCSEIVRSTRQPFRTNRAGSRHRRPRPPPGAPSAGVDAKLLSKINK